MLCSQTKCHGENHIGIHWERTQGEVLKNIAGAQHKKQPRVRKAEKGQALGLTMHHIRKGYFCLCLPHKLAKATRAPCFYRFSLPK